MAKTERRSTGKLSAVELKTKRPGMHGDGGGLWLQVTPNGRGRSWIFRFTLNGKAREMGLGSIEDVGLAEARQQAKQCRDLIKGSPTTPPVDPIEHRRAVRAAAVVDSAKATSFRACADAYIAAHRAGWRNPKHAAQWPSTLEKYVYPVFGSLPVSAIGVGLVIKALEPVWTTRPETASRVRGRIEVILDYAAARGWRQGENPARWRGHLDKLLPKPSKAKQAVRRLNGRTEHHAALPFGDIAAFLAELRRHPGMAARALEFTILTAARTGEVIGARWEEFDLAERVWTIPAVRMKGGKEHRVPLSDAALAIVAALAEHQHGDVRSGVVFPGGVAGKPLSNMAMLKLLERMERDDVTVHGFRSAFRDWAAERTTFSTEVAEMALAHAVSDKVEAAYRRGDLFAKRRRLMDAWSKFCGTAPAGANVVVLARR